MTTRRVAFACDVHGLSDDDVPAVEALARRGVEVEAVRWDDGSADWAKYDAMLPRSTWDYHRRAEEFAAWLRRVAMQTRVINPLPALLWNAHKSYLGELALAGVPTVPTEWVWRTDPGDLASRIAALPWDEAIFKPAVSAGAYGLTHVRRGAACDLDALRALIAAGDGMFQPLLHELGRDGETSLLYFGGVFSHAVRRPSPFAHGAQVLGAGRAVEPSAAERVVAERALAALPGDLLYARIDLAPSDAHGPRVMEVELLEPSLFFREGAGAAESFAAALAGRLTS